MQIPIALGGRRQIEEGLGDTSALFKGILDWGRRRLNRGEDGVANCYLREHILHRSCHVVIGLHPCLKCPPFLFEQAIDVTLDLLIFVINRLTFCPVDISKFIANLRVEVLLALAQLLNARVLP